MNRDIRLLGLLCCIAALTWACEPNDRTSEGGVTDLLIQPFDQLPVGVCDATPILSIADMDGPNPGDEADQKDLTLLEFDDRNLPDFLCANWQWDGIGWPGNNTGNACSLFDTDGDNFVDYALCVTVVDDPAVESDTRLYRCGDDKPDRCTPTTTLGSTTLDPPGPAGLHQTECVVEVVDANPFPGEDDGPNDTKVSCAIDTAALPAEAQLVNVCSYQGQEPDSGPSDCVIFEEAAFLTIETSVTPDDGTPFVFTLDPADISGQTEFTINGSGTVGTIRLLPGDGPFTLSEAVPNGWALSDASCVPTGGSPFDPRAGAFDVVEQTTTTCTFTNGVVGTVIVEEQTVPEGDLTQFTFTGDVAGDIGDNGTLMVDVAPGTHTATEVVPAGWDLTSIVCTDTDSSGDVGTATATFVVDPGETVTCTFTTAKKGEIVVEKQTDPDGSSQVFSFDGPGTFDPSLTDGQADTLEVAPGQYTVSAIVPTGWMSTAVQCDDGGSAIPSTGDVPTATATYNVEAGESVTCVFNNTQNGSIVVVKNTVGGDDTFEFTSATLSPSPFTVTTSGNTGNTSFSDLAPGTYDIAESDATPQWDLTSATCDDDDGTDPSNIVLDAGETVTCTFTNTERASIRVAKETLPDGDPATFDFTGAITATLGDGQASTPVLVAPGEYFVTEGDPRPAFDLAFIQCDDANSTGDASPSARTATFHAEAGEEITCTFTNVKRGTLIIEKQTDPDGASGAFRFKGSVVDQTIGDGEQIVVEQLRAIPPGIPGRGTYAVTEADPTPEFDLTDITCDDESSATPTVTDVSSRTARFKIDPGETVKCVFTNTQRGDIVIVKELVAGSADGTFSFTGDVGPFDLTTVSGTASTTTQFENTVPGTYSVTETDPTPDYDLVDLQCVDPSGGTSTLDATATIDLAPGETVTCTFENRERGTVNLLKKTYDQVNPNVIWKFEVYEGPDGFGGTQLAASNTYGDVDGVLEFGGVKLNPDETFTICERNVPAGWATFWNVDTDGDGVADMTVIPYNPNADDAVPADLGNDCFDFGASTSYAVPVGGTLVFEVNNTFPGGDPRSPGYWKNWNTCTNGNQAETAAKNGGPDEGWFILDDILNDPGIIWNGFQILTCEDGVSILDQRDLRRGRKRANDAAYTLAMHLMSAQLNFAAGAEQCPAAMEATVAAEDLLVSLGFDGTNGYLRPKDAEFSTALELAAILDSYNNGNLCSP